jgi:hypothetical protein
VDQKLLENPMKTKGFLQYIKKTKPQKLGSPKNEKIEKT